MLTKRELKFKVSLLFSILYNNLFKIKFTINILNITKYLFVTNLLALFLSSLKLSI